MELTQCSTLTQFAQTFLTNPSNLRFYPDCDDHRNFDSVNQIFKNNVSRTSFNYTAYQNAQGQGNIFVHDHAMPCLQVSLREVKISV